MKKKPTKACILEAAESLMLEQSFHSVGLKQLLDAVKVPKGSFYYYFESKDQFGAELIHHYMKEGSAFKREMLLNPERGADPLQRLFLYLDGSVDFMKKHPGKYPCLAVKLASEVSGMSEAMRGELVTGFQQWIGIYQAALDEAVEAGLLPADFDTAKEAALIQDHWAGAAQRSVTFLSPEPVRLTVEHIKTRIQNRRL